MPVAILGQIKNVNRRLSASGDKLCDVKMSFNDTPGVNQDAIDELSRLFQPDRGIYVVFFDEAEYLKLEENKKSA